MVSVNAATPVPGSSWFGLMPLGDHGLQQRGALGDREGVRLPRRAKHRNGITAFVQQIAAMRNEARMIGRELGVERSQRGGEHAMWVQGLGVQR